jgi:hypothetical protein
MVYGRRQPRMKNVNFEFKRREGSRSAHETIEEVPGCLEDQKGQQGESIFLEVLCA